MNTIPVCLRDLFTTINLPSPEGGCLGDAEAVSRQIFNISNEQLKTQFYFYFELFLGVYLVSKLEKKTKIITNELA